MKKFLSALLVVLMVGTMTISASAELLSPGKIIQPYGTTPPPSAVGGADIQNPKIPAEGGRVLPGNENTVTFAIYDSDRNKVGEITLTFKPVNDLPADDPARKAAQKAIDNKELPGQVVSATSFAYAGDPDKSVFASDFGGEGSIFIFEMDFSALNQFAINPRFWFYNSETGKFDEAFAECVENSTYSITTSHACPLLVTIDGYESYYSRFVGKKVTSPDTLAAIPTATLCTVVSVFGAAGVSKKHI